MSAGGTSSGDHRDTLVVATTNRGKLLELEALVAGLPLTVKSLAQLVVAPPKVVEDGATFAENAVKKARAAARATMMLTLADDSGLEVDALDGRPGVRSARFAHDRATDAENNAALIAALGGLHEHSVGPFKARFRCVLALVDPFADAGEPRTVEAACEGCITRSPRGSGGFGYDPLFVVAGMDKTMAELDEAEKNRVSHRARAFAALVPLLGDVIRKRAAQVALLEARSR
jgi:XTP/dITP diphosphohydrolase